MDRISGDSLAGRLGDYRNKIINGDFNIGQRGLSFASGNTIIYTLDRWKRSTNVSSMAIARALTNDLAMNGMYQAPYAAVSFTGTSGAGDYAILNQPIEDVRALAGKQVTVSFWASGTAGLKMGIELVQNFGSGGSPSAEVLVSSQVITVSTVWQKYSLVFNVPNILGATFGSNGNHRTELFFWLSNGSSYASRSQTGVQSGSINIGRVSVVESDARLEADPFTPRNIQQELDLCQRYYEIGNGVALESSRFDYTAYPYKVTKRAVPAVALTGASFTIGGSTVNGFNQDSANASLTGFTWTADAEL